MTAHAQGGTYLITGPMAAGKSTVAGLLARRFRRGVHLEGDFFRRSIASDREEMSANPSHEALEQLRLRYRLAAAAADAYRDAGFTVVLEDVVGGPLLAEYVELVRSRPLYVVVLLPSIAALTAREGAREKKGYRRWAIEEHRQAFAADTPQIGLWLDTSEQTAEETVNEIFSRRDDCLVD